MGDHILLHVRVTFIFLGQEYKEEFWETFLKWKTQNKYDSHSAIRRIYRIFWILKDFDWISLLESNWLDNQVLSLNSLILTKGYDKR